MELASSFSSSYRFSTMFSYASGKFNNMCVVISIFSIFMFSFRRYPLSSLRSMIQSLVYLVTLSSSHFANFLCSLVQEATVIGSNFLKTFTPTRLASPYLLTFVLPSCKICKHTVSSWESISSLYPLLLRGFNVVLTPL